MNNDIKLYPIHQDIINFHKDWEEISGPYWMPDMGGYVDTGQCQIIFAPRIDYNDETSFFLNYLAGYKTHEIVQGIDYLLSLGLIENRYNGCDAYLVRYSLTELGKQYAE